MNIHKNARLTPHGRAEVVRLVLEDGQSARAVARDAAHHREDRPEMGRARAGRAKC